MGVGGPRVGVCETRHEMPQARRRRRPQPECAVDVHPGRASGVPCAWATRAASPNGVESPGVHVARLQADDRRTSRRRELRRVRRRRCGPGRRRPTGVGAPRPRYRSATSTVPCRSAPTRTRTRGPPVSPDVCTSQPACASTCCRAAARAGEVRHRRAGDEPDVGAARAARAGRAASVPPPPRRRRGRRRVAHAGVLVPGADQPVGRRARRAASPPMTQPKNRPLASPSGRARRARRAGRRPPQGRSGRQGAGRRTRAQSRLPTGAAGPPDRASSRATTSRAQRHGRVLRQRPAPRGHSWITMLTSWFARTPAVDTLSSSQSMNQARKPAEPACASRERERASRSAPAAG